MLMKLKIGRNDKCPCGSGLKFKKCHLGRPGEAFRERLQKPEGIETGGLLTGRPFITTEFKGHKVVAVGSRVYPRLPINVTFHEFIITFLKDILGPSWGMAEQAKPDGEQHIVVKWITEMSNLLKNSPYRIENPARSLKSAQPSGNVQSLLAFAYDIYSVYHCGELPDGLIARIKNNDQFQGAKYEIAVAAIFARAGFDLRWIGKSTNRVCEFIAVHKTNGEKIIVEAKSRHRRGVLNRPGKVADLTKMTSEVGRLFSKALKKETNELPFMIFIDLNLPLTDGPNDLSKRWIGDIKKMLSKHPMGTLENPEKFTALLITNFSWHYHDEDTYLKRSESVTILPLFPKARLKNPGLVDTIRTAVDQYGKVPPVFPKN